MNTLYIDWNFDPLIDMDLTRFSKRVTVIQSEDINPIFLDKLSSCGLRLVLAESFYSYPGFCGLVHVDGNPTSLGESWESRCKINLVNVPKTLTQWYDILPENRVRPNISKTPIGTNFIHYDSVPNTVIEDAYLSGWHLFESGVPHKVINKSEYHRWSLCFVACPIGEPDGWSTMDVIRRKLKI